MDYKNILGTAAVIISFGSYVPYLRSILRNQTRPHAFSWLVWALLAGIAFAAQLFENGGIGSWVTGSSSLLCFVIFFLSLSKGEKHFDSFDWTALIAALLAIPLWKFTKNPTFSVILISVIDAVGFLPTYRKGYFKPNEERAGLYFLSTIKYILGILALRSFTLATWLFPASLILTNCLFVLMLLVRRRQQAK
jgi:hypothetical protein